MQWFNWLLDSDSFNTRNTCGVGWTDKAIAMSQLSNALIALAYFAIPLSLAVLYFKLRKLNIGKVNPWILWMFVAFITLCGLAHLNHVIVFWVAPYRLFILMDFLTAIVSLITAIILPVVLYDFIRSLPGHDQK